MKEIRLRSIPHKAQRYESVGDYTETRTQIKISVSDMKNTLYEQLVAVHELVEVILVNARHIPHAAIDKFDLAFEAAREPGNEDEPGHDQTAPYHKEHVFAEQIERMLAKELGVDWDTYDQTVMRLSA